MLVLLRHVLLHILHTEPRSIAELLLKTKYPNMRHDVQTKMKSNTQSLTLISSREIKDNRATRAANNRPFLDLEFSS